MKLNKLYSYRSFIINHSIEAIFNFIESKKLEKTTNFHKFFWGHPIEYEEFKINQRTVIVSKRSFSFANNRGIGSIKMHLEPNGNSTKINATINPITENHLIGLLTVFIIIMLIILLTGFLSSILFEFNLYMLLPLIAGSIIYLLMTYLFIRINRNRLEYYLDSIINDLESIT